MEPAAKQYIQKFGMSKNKKVSSSSSIMDIKKECLMKGVDPLDSEYIDWKLDKNFDVISPQWKKGIKEEIIKEVKMEMNEKLEELKKEYNAKFDISFLDEDIMEIGGHDKSQKNNKKEY
jgi:hypothetical protein